MLGLAWVKMIITFVIMSLVTSGIKVTASNCGQYNYGRNLIRGGTPVFESTDWPWIVGLFHRDQQSTTFKCGGSLVTSNVVVTAAHCVMENGYTLDGTDIVLVMGRTAVQNWPQQEFVQIKNALNVVIHPSYLRSTKFGADLAFLELNTSVTITDYVSPVCLWNNGVFRRFTGNIGTVVGWGKDDNGSLVSETARMINLPIVEKNTCLASNAQMRHIVNEYHYCAGRRDGTGPCNGDSGNGMFVIRTKANGDKFWVLRGVVSRTLKIEDNPNECDLNNYVAFTDMAHLKPSLSSTSCSRKYPIPFYIFNMTKLGDKYYYFMFDSEKKLNWTSAQLFCRSHGLQLASVETEEENNLIGEHLKRNLSEDHQGRFWLGGHDSEEEGTWRWSSGQQLYFTDWSQGQPDDYNGVEDCLEMTVHGSCACNIWWNDDDCSVEKLFVCELEDRACL